MALRSDAAPAIFEQQLLECQLQTGMQGFFCSAVAIAREYSCHAHFPAELLSSSLNEWLPAVLRETTISRLVPPHLAAPGSLLEKCVPCYRQQ